jgi:hypothetical protein
MLFIVTYINYLSTSSVTLFNDLMGFFVFLISECGYHFQITAVDWPYEESADSKLRGHKVQNIADYLADNHFHLVINLPMRSSGEKRASSFMTPGYRTRRMAVDYSIPLFTDIKCAKLFVEVRSVDLL